MSTRKEREIEASKKSEGERQLVLFRKRRRLIGYAFLGFNAAALGALALIHSVPINDEKYINAEVQRRGIKPNPKEIALWQGGYTESVRPTTFTNDQAPVVQNRLVDTLERMRNSENPYFTNASNFLLEQHRGGYLKFLVQDTGIHDMGVNPIATEQGPFHYNFILNPDFILNRSTALTAAATLTHEAEHVKRFAAYVATMQPGRVVDRKAYLESDFITRESTLIEEAHAYGIEAQAYIHQAGLLGRLYGVDISGQEDRAAKLVSLGGDPNSFEWKKYIASVISLPAQVPPNKTHLVN